MCLQSPRSGRSALPQTSVIETACGEWGWGLSLGSPSVRGVDALRAREGKMFLKHCRVRTWIHLFVMRFFFFLNQRKGVFKKKALAEKISPSAGRHFMPVHIFMSDFEKWRANAVSFPTRQKEELGVPPVGDPNVMTETLGLRLSHWHGRGAQNLPLNFESQ